jgi:hypothetical protein
MSVALVIQHAKRMRRTILSSLACPALPYFSTLSHKRHDFRKQLLNIKCVFLFSLQILSETFLILRRIQRDIIINVHRSSCQVPLLLSDFNVDRFSKNTQILYFIKTRPVGAK